MKTPLSLDPGSPWIRMLGHVLAVLLLAFATATAARASQVIPGNGSVVTVEVNKGSLVRLSRAADTVFIADPEVADVQMKSPSLVYLMGKRPGQTTLYAVGANESLLANVQVNVSHNLSRLSEAVRELHPNAEIALNSVDGAILVSGTVPSAHIAEDVRRLAKRYVGAEGEVINRLAVAAPTQVNLRVRVAEVSREIEKQLGFNWDIMGSVGGADIMFSTINPFAAAVNADQILTQFGPGNWDINALIDALDDEGLISVLAEPNLTAMTGETASFLAGGEFPILVPQGNDMITIEFKKFGVSLAFTPTIVNERRINLHVRPEVSQLSNEGAVSLPIGVDQALFIPALTTRRAETTVELGSGQSFAIAGLLQNNISQDIHKFPGLGDVPILGALFKSDRFKRNESELVIIITPYLVRPAATAMASPNDGYAPPKDLQRLLGGGTWRRDPNRGPASIVTPDGSRQTGTPGFLLD